jgi:hypothetical protein
MLPRNSEIIQAFLLLLLRILWTQIQIRVCTHNIDIFCMFEQIPIKDVQKIYSTFCTVYICIVHV